MIKNLKNGKGKLIISHVADVDGISALMLAQLHYGDVDYCLVEFNELDSFLQSIVDNDAYRQYDEIIVTDVSFKPAALEIVSNNPQLASMIRHFDHHASEAANMEKYPFVNEVIERDGKKACGTTLFYDYIKKDFKYNSEYLDKYLEAVRAYDTGGPFCGNQYGVDLTTLISIIGIDNYIRKFSAGIKCKKDPFNEDDIGLINQEREKMQDYIDQCDKTLVRIKLGDYNVGVSISELYRSSVGNVLSKKYKDELDFILIMNFMRGQFSFRTVRDDVNVSEIAKSLTPEGGGHPKAAGMPINQNTLFILNLVREAMINKERQMKLKPKGEQNES